MDKYQTIIVGGGPVGLYAAMELQKRGVRFLLLEASDALGGQITRLYPKKMVVDVPLFPAQKAEDIVSNLVQAISKNNIHLNERVLHIDNENDEILVKTPSNIYLTRTTLIATGLGESRPRPLGVPNEEASKEILYDLKDTSFLKGKRIVIFGGGDSALDWARDLSFVASKVDLVHRRDEFRGEAKTIDGCDVHLHMSYVPKAIDMKEGRLSSVEIEQVITKETLAIPCDYILVTFGQIPVPSTFNLPMAKEGYGILPKADYEVGEGVYVAGDVCYDQSKKKRMAPGFEEVDAILTSVSYRNRIAE